MKGDPLTDILSLTSARCAEVGILVGSWALRFPPPQKIKFVAVLKGNCWLTFKNESTPLQVKTGDVFVLPAERAYVLAGDLKAPQADGLKIFAAATGKIGKVGVGESSSRSERTSLWIPSVAHCSRRCCHSYFT
jgi:Cupin